MLDGMGDVVEGTFDFEIPTLNAYDVVASKNGRRCLGRIGSKP